MPTANSQSGGITTGPDGALWFAEFNGDEIGRAPAYGLSFNASFANSTLTLNYNLGVDTPADFSIRFRNPSGLLVRHT